MRQLAGGVSALATSHPRRDNHVHEIIFSRVTQIRHLVRWFLPVPRGEV